MTATAQKRIIDWFDRRYAAKGTGSMRPYEAYPIFLDHLNVQKGKTLLDIGCGTGYLLKAAEERSLKTFGVDYSRESAALARAVSPESRISVCNAENLQFRDDFFDYITCIGVLEHFLDVSKGLEELKRVTPENGLFCLMTPNSKSLVWMMSGMFSSENKECNENAYSLERWSEIFTDGGFEILAIHRMEWYFRKLLIILSLEKLVFIQKIINGIAGKLVPLRYATQFVFIMRKRNRSIR